MWLVVPVSRNHSEALGGGGATPVEFSVVYSAWLSQAVRSLADAAVADDRSSWIVGVGREAVG
jgi:hypothetical protein